MKTCTNCPLYEGGRCLPHWTPISEYVIIGEAPGKDEVNNEPFVGKAGKQLWEAMEELGFRKEQFGIINSVNCRPVDGNKNGKPTEEEQQECFQWVRKFIKIISPDKALVMGNYAKYIFTGSKMGIKRMNASSGYYSLLKLPLIYSVHPAVTIYDGENGRRQLRDAIRFFREHR